MSSGKKNNSTGTPAAGKGAAASGGGKGKGSSAPTYDSAPAATKSKSGGGKEQQQQQPATAGGGGKGGRGNQQGQQQQGQGGAKGGKGGATQVAAVSAKMTNEILSKYPRLDLDKENKQLTSLTELIDAAFAELDEVRKRIDTLQEERKELAGKNRETMDNKHDTNAIKEKAKQDRDALRKELDKQIAARKRRLEELNKAKANLPVKLNVKDSKKLVAINMEQLDKDEKAIELRMKSVATTGQDRAQSKELQAIAQKRRAVREWAKMAADAEAPVDPALEASLKEADELVKKLIEEERGTRKDVDRVKEALGNKSEELKTAKDERKAISEKIEKLKKDRDAVYGVIREKKKEHQDKIRQLQKEERDKRAQAEKEKREKLKKEKLQRQIQELSDAFKDELALCDRLTSFLVNRQNKQKKSDDKTEDASEDAKNKDEEGASEDKADEAADEDKDQETAGEESKGEGEEGEEGENAPVSGKAKGLQFSMAIHTDFEILSVRPPSTLEDIPAAIESIARKKAVYQRLAAVKLEQRQEIEAQLNSAQSDDSAASAKKQGKKQAAENGAAKKEQAKAKGKDKTTTEAAASSATEKEEEEEQAQPADEAPLETEAGDE